METGLKRGLILDDVLSQVEGPHLELEEVLDGPATQDCLGKGFAHRREQVDGCLGRNPEDVAVLTAGADATQQPLNANYFALEEIEQTNASGLHADQISRQLPCLWALGHDGGVLVGDVLDLGVVGTRCLEHLE